MENKKIKPKLLFFQRKSRTNLPQFLLMHRQHHVKCLSEFFEVVVIQEECDYQEVCEKYDPDLVIFEMLSGAEFVGTHRVTVKNISTSTGPLKVALHNADAWCDARSGFFSDMEHMGIDVAFSICATAVEHAPELSDKLFVWPNFIDSDVYRDYGEPKSIPILLSGSTSGMYPWRHQIFRRLSDHYPSLVCPHHGYYAESPAWRMMFGEAYARAINVSWFAPTCGTVAREVLRKHFEIPACRACLITERSQVLEAAGFADMKNCIFADGNNVLDKVEHLFTHVDELERIIDAGHQLVHSRHTLKQRSQILQWYNLKKDLRPNHKIVQAGPFEPLTVVETSSEVKNLEGITDALDIALLRQGDEDLLAGRYNEAESLYMRCLNHILWMPEPKLRLALCSLYKGDARTAMEFIAKQIDYILGTYRALDPDPVEWAYFIIALLCQGKVSEAAKGAKEFPWLRHPELDRVRLVITVLTNETCIDQAEYCRKRHSIHRLPEQGLDEWVGQLRKMLRACKQIDMSEKLGDSVIRGCEVEANSVPFHDPKICRRSESYKSTSILLLSHKSSIARVIMSVGGRVKRILHTLAHPLSDRFGYFLPRRPFAKRADEFLQTVRQLARSEKIETALVIGASSGEGCTEAFIDGILNNPNKPSVFCVNQATSKLDDLQRYLSEKFGIKCNQIKILRGNHGADQIEEELKLIKEEKKIGFFDAILIDGSELTEEPEGCGRVSGELCGAKFVVLDGINTLCNHRNYVQLVRDPGWIVVDANPALRNGYGIFRKAM